MTARFTLADIIARCAEEGDCLLWPLRPNTPRRAPAVGKQARNPRRVVFELTRGVELGPDLRVLDTCGSRRCCNADHLVALPIAKAAKAQAARGDFRRGTQSLARLQVRRSRSKLDAERARAIRVSREPSRVLAERYGVSEQTIRSIRNGTTWNEQAANASAFSYRPPTPARSAITPERTARC